ncbi:hypothetical protein ACFL0P_06465 [Candidatus Omnitrophota bacterium]
MNYLNNTKPNPRLLIFLPLVTYIISYFYLAYYHGNFFIFNTIVHEGGKYTLLQTMFYASHFLGHIPVCTVLAFFFVGIYLCLTKTDLELSFSKKIWSIAILLILLLVFSAYVSLHVFGYEDTVSFIGQKKQSVVRYEEGGNWKLSLPSTIMLFFLIPVYIYIIRKIFNRNIEFNSRGVFYIFLALALFFLYTFLFNRNISDAFLEVWKDPRYLAHSVREALTFPLTYFPILMYFILNNEKKDSGSRRDKQHRNFKYLIVFLGLIFTLGLFYQSYIPLTKGIGSLAQKPGFAKGGKLGISYLLASHYFEHFLDTIYFALLCLLLHGLAMNSSKQVRRI